MRGKKPTMDRRQSTEMALFDTAEPDTLNPWRFVKEADRQRISAWAGSAFDPRRRADDEASLKPHGND